MSYQVVAPLVIAKDQAGRLHHVYEGGVIPWLSKEQAEHFLSEGLVVKVADAAASANDGYGGPEKPKQVAPKADWVDFAVANGLTEDEAEAMTKAELIEQFG